MQQHIDRCSYLHASSHVRQLIHARSSLSYTRESYPCRPPPSPRRLRPPRRPDTLGNPIIRRLYRKHA